MVLRWIKNKFNVINNVKIDNNMSKIEQIQRLRVIRQDQWDNLIGKIGFLIHQSPFHYKVYQETQDLSIFFRIYEPGEDLNHLKEDLDEKESS